MTIRPVRMGGTSRLSQIAINRLSSLTNAPLDEYSRPDKQDV